MAQVANEVSTGVANSTNTSGGTGAQQVQATAASTASSESNSTDNGGSISGKVICTELYRQGLLKEKIFKADQEFGYNINKINPNIITGYHIWAKPVVKLMQKSKIITKIVYIFAKPWAEEMAYEMNIIEKGNIKGKIIMNVGIIICSLIGEIISIPYYYMILLFLSLIISYLIILILRKYKFKKNKMIRRYYEN